LRVKAGWKKTLVRVWRLKTTGPKALLYNLKRALGPRIFVFFEKL
jgi:hypothetical protein